MVLACTLTIGCRSEGPESTDVPHTDVQVIQGYAELDGGSLYYETAGAGEPIVFIHGSSLDRRMWDDQFEVFARSSRVVRYDIRGFGKSSVPVEGETYSHHDDLAALLDHLGISSAHIVGLSLGSAIGLDFVLAYPDRSRSLVTAGPWVFGYSSPAVAEIGAAFGSAAAAISSGLGSEAAADSLVGSPAFAESILDKVVLGRLRDIAADYSFWHLSHADPGSVVTPLALERLSEISVPTLVIMGSREIAANREVGEMLQENVPDARTVEIPDAGHAVNMENPAEFNRVVSGFLSTVAGSAAAVPGDASGDG